MRQIRLFFAVLFSLLPTQAFGSSPENVCANIFVQYGEQLDRVSFTKLEFSLVCPGQGGSDWIKIPTSQQESFLRKFLAARGFYFPSIKVENGRIDISIGPKSLVNRIEIKNDILDLDPERFWTVYGETLDTSNLDSIESWIRSSYSLEGYPCITLDTKAYPARNLVIVSLGNTKKKYFGQIIEDSSGLISQNSKRRFDAFSEGDTYSWEACALTSMRIKNHELALESNFSPLCVKNSDTVDLKHKTLLGKPRIVSFGVGIDSEELLFLEAGWKHSRLFASASNIASKVYVSRSRQQLLSNFNWYYSPLKTRHHLRTSFEAEHRKTSVLQSKTIKFGSGPVIDLDRFSHHIYLWMAPSIDHSQTLQGSGPQVANTFSVKAQSYIESHDFELFKADPRSGHLLGAELQHAQRGMGSNYTATNYHLFGKFFHNILDLNPPIWVVGFRFGLRLFDHKKEDQESIPASAFPRLGGSGTVRGFSHDSIPNSGADLIAYGGAEFRVANIVPYGIQPYLFIDIAKFSADKMPFGSYTLVSPGLGIHWKSILGVFRFYLSHPLVTGPAHEEIKHPSGVSFNLNLGDEF